jgi:hypothetical protein
MKATARIILRHSLLVTLAVGSTAALAACASGSGAAQDTAAGGSNISAPPSSGAASASTGAPASAGGASASVSSGPNGGVTAADVPEVARALACPAPGTAAPQVALRPSDQRIPAGFRPVAAVQCLAGGAFISLHGEGAHVRKEAAVAGLGPLVAALREPSAAGAGADCPGPVTTLPGLALIGRNGVVIYPRIPVTACGAPTLAVAASLAALHWILLPATVPQGVLRVPQGVLRVPQGVTRPLVVQPQRALSPPIVVRPGSGLSVAG